MNTIVLKFGGTSVADNNKLMSVAGKITSLVDEDYKVIVVVSAQGKKTDSLLNEAYELSDNPDRRALDLLLSSGEQMSVSKLSIVLNEFGYKAIALTGWQAGIYTSNNYQNAIIERIDTSRIKYELEKNNVVIVAGFQGIDSSNNITTLGRGGSDTTAVSIAAALGLKNCYIYSDVEGVFTADPRIVSTVKKNKSLSYDEMIEIADEGAKVLHNRCVEIGKKFNIPITAKSTFEDGDGTVVNDCIEAQKVKSLVKNDNLVYMRFDRADYIEAFKTFIKNDIKPVELSNNNCSVTALLKKSDSKKACLMFDNEADISDSITRVSIVGYDISNNVNVLNDILIVLQGEAEHIKNIELSNSKIRITFDYVINNDLFKKLHDKLI